MEPLTDEEREAKIATLEAEQENKEAEKEEQKEAEKSEHEDKYFVVNGGTCVCNKAQDVNKEAEIVVSKNSKLIINDDAKKFAATEEDIKMKPASSTFGKCILQPTSSDYLACMPAFLPKWEKAYDKKTVDGKKILTELSTLQCTIGGKIEIKKHGQENSVVKEHAENTNAAEQALVNPAVPMPVLEMKYPSVSSIVLKEITGRARFGEIKSEGSGVEKIRIRLNEELTFKANLNKGNEKLTSWVIYEMKMGKVAAKFITLEQKGTSFQNTFSTLGTYRVEGYGKPKTPTYNDGKNDKNYTDCSIDVEVIVNKLDGNVLLPKEASNFTRVKGKENTLRQGTPATFEAKFLLDPNKEELGNLQIYATDASGNVVTSGTQAGNTFTFIPTNSKAKYTILAKYTNLEGQVETQTFSATTESIYVNSISHADEVIRPETPMTFKVVNTQFKTTGSLTNEEAATVKWNLNGQLVGTGSCVEIPGVYFLKEGKYVVEAYVNTANASVTSGSNKDNEKDDWHFEVKKNDVLRFGYIGGVPKVGKTTQLKADKFIMQPIAGEKVVWNVFGKILENTSYNNPVIDITPGYARKENVTCKINHQKGVSQSIEIVQAEILDAHFTDSNGIKIENASWEQTVYIYIDAKHLSGEEINIKVYDQDYFDGNDHVGSVNTKSYNGKPLEFKLDKTVKDKTGSNGKLYFKVSAPHLTLKNSDTRFPSEKLTVEDAINFENPIIGEENGLKKHYLVDYDDISWFYVNTTGIKDTTKLKIGVWQYNKEKELVHILALKHTLDKDGVLKAKIEWNKIQKNKTSRIVYIRVKDENDKILCDSVSKINEAALTLQFTPTAVKMVENKAAMVVGTQGLQGTSCGEKYCVKKGDKSELIREVNIRLAGFGGNVPTDEFTDRTEKMIKQFQRDYMKVAETGKICGNLLRAIDQFQNQYNFSFDEIKCKCGTCNGFGDNSNKGIYLLGSSAEAYHRYEYPGLHRSLLSSMRSVIFYLAKDGRYSLNKVSSGYRCRFHEEYLKKPTTNHMGKALDLHFNKAGSRTRENEDVEIIRKDIFNKYLGAKWDWTERDIFNLESTSVGAITWVHYDVREFNTIYLQDQYFTKTIEGLNGKSIVQLARELGFDNTCSCMGNSSSSNNNVNNRVDPKTLKTSDKGIQFIKDWEKFEPNLYNDDSEGEHCTIGYGHLVHSGPCNGSESEEFKNGISEVRATELFNGRLLEFEQSIQRDITVNLFQYEFDALVSLVFNSGSNFLNTGGANEGETKIKKNINNLEYEAGADEMADVTNGGLSGLVKRRQAEINIFKNNIYDSTH